MEGCSPENQVEGNSPVSQRTSRQSLSKEEEVEEEVNRHFINSFFSAA
jgi:hypothetical protein